MPEFDRYEADYEGVVNRALGSWGDVDRFAARKARLLATFLAERFGDSSSLRVLDVGSGVGLTDRHLQGRFRLLAGAEVAYAASARARREVPECSCLCYDGERLPLADGSVDAAFTICVLHHVEEDDREQFLREIARVLRPGGTLCVFEQNPWNPATRWVVSRCEFDRGVKLVRAGRLRELLKGAGFRSVGRRYCTFFPMEGSWVAALEERLAAIPIGAQYMCFGTKPA